MNGKEKIKALDDAAGDIGVGVTDLIVDGQQIEGIDTIIVINPRKKAGFRSKSFNVEIGCSAASIRLVATGIIKLAGTKSFCRFVFYILAIVQVVFAGASDVRNIPEPSQYFLFSLIGPLNP